MYSFNRFKIAIEFRFRTYRKKIITRYYRIKTSKIKFCIFSNDCWGAELYKLTGRSFNTPFIGLMLMAPCYIKLLEDPVYYLGLPLNFIKSSRYPLMQQLNAGSAYPLALLGDSDIEIHFLHYASSEIAKEKWERRVQRIDWKNLYIKFDCGKDYADKKTVEQFLALPFKNKLIFGKSDFGMKEIIVLNQYSDDAVKQFKNCFQNFNPVLWLLKNPSTIESTR